MARKPETLRASTTVVAVGSFNPVIFEPRWLVKHGAMTEVELELLQREAAQVSEATALPVLVTPVATVLKWSSRVLDVNRDRMVLGSDDPAKVFDIAKIVFGQLPHTPVRALGINLETQFRMHTIDAWHRFGDELAPKGTWEFFLGDTAKVPTSIRAGVKTIAMRRPRLAAAGPATDSRFPGYTDLEVGPLLDPPVVRGAYVRTNDHYEMGGSGATAQEAASVLEERWNASINESGRVTQYLLQLAEGFEQ